MINNDDVFLMYFCYYVIDSFAVRSRSTFTDSNNMKIRYASITLAGYLQSNILMVKEKN